MTAANALPRLTVTFALFGKWGARRMPITTALTLRARLWGSTALVASSPDPATRRRVRWPVAASAAATLLGAGIMTVPGHAAAQDVNLAIAGDTLNLTTTGNQVIGSLSGVAGTLVILGESRLTTGSPASSTFAGVISGTGALIKEGAGVLTLTGANTYTGYTIISAGTIAIGAGGSLSPNSHVALDAAARFDISAADSPQNIASLTGSQWNEVLLGANNVIVNQTANTIYSGVISGTGGLVKTARES